MEATFVRRQISVTAPRETHSACSYYVPAIIIALGALAVRLATGGAPVFPVDDAYITAHNAQVLHWGHDPNFANTPALAGATSPFHLALVALLMFFMQPLWALDAAGWLGVLAFAMGIAHLARTNSVPPVAAALLVIAGLLAARAPHQMMNGLETGWAMAGVTWALALSSGERLSSRIAFGALCGTLPAVRPELAALSLLLLPLPAVRAWRTARTGRTAVPILGTCLLTALLAAAPWLIWQFSATGSVIPATISAKRYYFAESGIADEAKWYCIKSYFTQFLCACGLLAVAGIALPFTAAGRAGLAFTCCLLYAYYREFPGALSHAQGRYLYILLPLLVYGGATAFRLLHARPAVLRWAEVFVLAAAFQAILLAPYTWREHEAEQTKTRVELAGVAGWCVANLPSTSRLLIHDAGYLSYATRFPMADLVGLKTPANISLHREFTYESHGKLRAVAINAAARRANPDYVVILDLWDGIYQISDGLRRNGWTLEPVRSQGIYHVYRMRFRSRAAALLLEPHRGEVTSGHR